MRLDGAEYEAREGDELARWIGYLPQVPSLFAGSIKDNISRFSTSPGVDHGDRRPRRRQAPPWRPAPTS